jgi:hypothetical protein
VAELEEVEKELQKLSEPAKASAQSRRFKASLDAFNNRLTEIYHLLSPEAVATYREQFLRTQAAHEAASIAGRARFDKDPLGPTVGTLAWRRLYEMAEEFNSIAYPGEAFPAISADKVCVLCQQPFSEQAAGRMTRFKQFMQDTSQQEARTQGARLGDLIRGLETARVPTTAEMDLLFAELSAAEPSFGSVRTAVDQFISESSALVATATAALKGDASFATLPNLDRRTIDLAKDYANRLEQKAKAFDEATVDAAITSDLRKKHTELLGRQRLKANSCVLLIVDQCLKRISQDRPAREYQCERDKQLAVSPVRFHSAANSALRT